MTEKLPYADEINYWQSGQSSPDVWIEKTKAQLTKLGAVNISEGFGASNGRAAYILRFEIEAESFRVVWPVLPTRKPEQERAARIQAATLLYHDCKARAISAAVLGARTMFFHALELPDGRTVGEVATPHLLESMPNMRLLSGPK